ncbi:MAG: cysteine desulfurase [Bacteroidales bacterium]|nr:cysteine desulfurase [Bacteroidales bacterium]
MYQQVAFDVSKIRKDFPALHQEVNGKSLVYLDNAATSQKPQAVIDSILKYYTTINSNVHRGVHSLSRQATEAFEEARKHFQRFINAEHAREVIITKGATDSINLVAHSFGSAYLKEGSEVIISALEHHANIVPWQVICEQKGARLRVIPLTENSEIDLEVFASMLNEKTAIVAIGHISNALGVINPVKEIIRLSHNNNVPVMIDGAQGIVHENVDVQDLDCDFYCFSSHKFYGPMGVGILYGKEKFLEKMPPYQTGGEMIESVTFDKTTYNELPFKFETGTPNVADVIGFDAAISYIENIGMEEIMAYENELLAHGISTLKNIDGVRILADGAPKAGVISFLIDDIHPFDAGTIIDKLGIAVRTGHHCAQPVMDLLKIPGSVRASLAFYNTTEEIDRLHEAIKIVKQMFG